MSEWWEYFLEPGVRAARAAEQSAAASAGAAISAASAAAGSVHKRAAELEREVKMMRGMIFALTETLIEAKVVDPAQLGERFGAQLNDLFPPPPPKSIATPKGSPYRGAAPPEASSGPKSKRPALTTPCASCKKKVPRHQTYVLPAGAVCEACYQAAMVK